MDLLKLVASIGGRSLPLGEIAFPVMEALIELLHKLPTDPQTGAPMSKEQLLAALRAQIAAAGAAWGSVADAAKQELAGS